MLRGYARVSGKSQDLTLQLEELKAAGCARVYSEKMSGARSYEFCTGGERLDAITGPLQRERKRLARSLIAIHNIDERPIRHGDVLGDAADPLHAALPVAHGKQRIADRAH